MKLIKKICKLIKEIIEIFKHEYKIQKAFSIDHFDMHRPEFWIAYANRVSS